MTRFLNAVVEVVQILGAVYMLGLILATLLDISGCTR